MVGARNAGELKGLLVPDVLVGFGPQESGWEAFEGLWHPGDPASKLWDELEALLELGASGGDARFVIPYVSARWPEAIDPLTHSAVIRPDVDLRERPDGNARVLIRLSHSIVRLVEGDEIPGGEWTHVALSDGTEGYVPAWALRRPVELRIECVQIDGRWQVASILEGD